MTNSAAASAKHFTDKNGQRISVALKSIFPPSNIENANARRAITIVQQRPIQASLRKENLNNGLMALAIGLGSKTVI
ncbi:hypothetical protein [Paraglaciecola arctica]|uniref:Uncharacterized protein n=1 Tax=Paraglaciecola arctica BSs20135 TaxID=493475 RepID=K6YTU4_9ALTE|nr:hypothetical protein [Paraglaciecola arctica]GAC21592.1 hypothetical protein GARC_4650 [Paraglaciecola arctica BSs20135]